MEYLIFNTALQKLEYENAYFLTVEFARGKDGVMTADCHTVKHHEDLATLSKENKQENNPRRKRKMFSGFALSDSNATELLQRYQQ